MLIKRLISDRILSLDDNTLKNLLYICQVK